MQGNQKFGNPKIVAKPLLLLQVAVTSLSTEKQVQLKEVWSSLFIFEIWWSYTLNVKWFTQKFASQQNFLRKARNWENFDAFVNIDLGIFFWGSDSGVNSIKWSWFICRLLLHGYCSNILHMYGTDGVTKTDEFSENFHRGECGGVGNFQSQIFCCRFLTSKQRPFGTFPKIHPFWWQSSVP